MYITEVKAALALHYVFSLLNPMYIPYAAVYFVDRVYISCRLSSACAEISLTNYMTEEVIIMGVGAILHIPIWALCLRIVDIRKSGGKVRDVFHTKAVSLFLKISFVFLCIFLKYMQSYLLIRRVYRKLINCSSPIFE